ncbi:sugar ABC transporter ATP-binding protein [Cohnella soli]|uniref:Sugar ABC transporter ATP-binding protein n=1 Tax=Cohnella soli TaxID=425005 RepID=A0ABW0HME0_9BACL
MSNPAYRLQMKDINKSFSGNQVLYGVDLEVPAGNVLALLGENGAGKSTLMKILNGDYSLESGEIAIDGGIVVIDSPRQAVSRGIRVIYQELNYVKDTTVIENVLLGSFPRKWGAFFDWKTAESRTREVLGLLNANIDPYARVADLNIAEKQLVEIAKAFSTEAKILVMDEPTAALTSNETKNLFKVIRQLKEKGVSVIYISHRLEEIAEIADLVMVMQDGRRVGYGPVSEFSPSEIVRLMVGREVNQNLARKERSFGPAFLNVVKLSKEGSIRDVSFDLHKGEILGLYGLLGSGINDVTKAIFGAAPADGGQVVLDGKPRRFNAPHQAMKAGIAYVAADRKVSGLILDMSVKNNLTLANIRNYVRLGFMKDSAETQSVNEWVQKLAIKLSGGIEREVRYLSGGNQQKVILSRWLDRGAQVLILNEPTMGVDIGSRADIYRFLDEMRNNGLSIIVASSDMAELQAIADRVVVIRNGEVVSNIRADGITKEKLLASAMGVGVS